MKKILIILLFAFSLLLCGCNKHWEFTKPYTEIESISIIYIEEGLGSRKECADILNLPHLKEIDESLYEELYEDIISLEIPWYRYIVTAPAVPEGFCFLIDYGNDYYCLLASISSGYIYYENNELIYDYKQNGLTPFYGFEEICSKYINEY